MKKYIVGIRKKLLAIGIVIIAVGSFSFVDGYFEISKNMEIMHSAVKELNSYYVDEIKPGELITKGIAGMLESKQGAGYYSEMATRKVGKYGNSRGWRRNRLRTEHFTIDGMGLDSGEQFEDC